MPHERWSLEQVRALASDPASARAGQGLGAPARWSASGLDGDLLWGQIRSYDVAVDLTGPAFSCSCPSRKIPCKHTLGLLFLWATAGVGGDPTPDYVDAWRQARAARAARAQRPRPDGPADPEAARKRARQREERVAAGLTELGRWLDDQVQQGLAAAEGGGYGPFDEMAARLVDAQAPAAAAAVRRLGGQVGVGPHWADRVLGEMGLLRLLVDGYDRLAELPDGLAATVRTRVGFPVSSADVLAGPRVRDRWRWLGRVDSDDGTLQSRRIWLHGAHTGRFALLLSFAAPGQTLQSDVVPGADLDAELCFYPGAHPLRALVAERHPDLPPSAPPGQPVRAALAGWSAALAAEPWRPDVPVLLAGVRPADDDWLVDEHGDALPLSAGFRHPWWLIAAGGGRPATVAGEWSPAGLRPLAVWAEGQWTPAPEQTYDGPPRRGPELPPDLLAAALVGTARRPWQADPVPVGGRALDTGAGALLEAAGAALVYHRGGVPPARGHQPIAPAPADTLPALPVAVGERLRRILTPGEAPFGSTATPAYLAEWLTLAAGRGGRAPSGQLPGLLDQAGTHADLRGPVSRVAGERGRWLAGLRPEWAWLRAETGLAPDPAGWAGASTDERVAMVRQARRVAPAGGRQLVESTWEGDPAQDRAQFLAELRHGLSLADESLLERALDDRHSAVRTAALELLRGLPGTAWSERMAARARAAVRVERRLIGRDRLVVTPPDGLDEQMRRDGLTPASGDGRRRAGGPGAHRLEEVVAGTPLAVWRAYAKSPAALIDMARADDWADALLHGWAQAAVDQGDVVWASALIANDARDDGPALRQIVRWDLHALLPPAELAGIVVDYLQRRDYQVSRLLKALRGPWPHELAVAVLAALERGVRSDPEAWLVHELCPPAIAGLPTRYATKVGLLAEELERELGPRVRIRPIAELAAALTFRTEMHLEFE